METDFSSEVEQYIEKLLYGSKEEAKQAKDSLKKYLRKGLNSNWKDKEQHKKDREVFDQKMSQVYEKIFASYENIQNHNKSATLSFLGHSLFFFREDINAFEKFLVYVRESLKEITDGSLRQIAVTTSNNTYAISTINNFSTKEKKISDKRRELDKKYRDITIKHLNKIFDELEMIIEKDKNNFPVAIEAMKSSVVKSYLLYIFSFDRFDALSQISGMYEEDSFWKNNDNFKMWKSFYQDLLKTHPNIKNFIKNVPRFDLHKYEDEESFEYDSSEIPEIIKDILDDTKERGVPSLEFFFEENIKEQELFLGGFHAPKDSYFEILDLIKDVENKNYLFEIFNMVYIKAWGAPVSEMYWYDLVDFVLSKYDDVELRLKILKEAIKKLSSKVDINLPINKDDKNNIHYGFHELRPIFRILAAYALCNDEHGDKKVAKQYYEFLLKLNPYDNQGVRYLLASMYAGKPAKYVDVLFEEGNKKQNWDKIENFLDEQNEKYHFWSVPK